MELAYAGKTPEGQLLTSTPALKFRTKKTYGHPAPGVWVNRLIQGDNRDVLQALLNHPQVAGRVTLAYIDPPFATRQDFRAGRARTSTISAAARDRLAYEDRLLQADYLEALRQRLILLRELLAGNGSLWVHIGSQMAHYVRVLLDEIFGPENFLNEVARIKCNPKNFSRRAFGNIKDTLLYYSKTGGHVWNEQREAMSEEDLARLFPRTGPSGERYATTPLHAPGETRQGPTGRRWKGLLPPPGRHWRYSPDELTRLDRAGLIEWSEKGNPRKMIFAKDAARSGKKRQDIWTFKDSPYPSYPTEKNLALLETIVLTSSHPGDLVLDCYAGSATTLVAAQMHQRRWIGIDRSAVSIEKSLERLRRSPAAHPFQLERAILA